MQEEVLLDTMLELYNNCAEDRRQMVLRQLSAEGRRACWNCRCQVGGHRSIGLTTGLEFPVTTSTATWQATAAAHDRVGALPRLIAIVGLLVATASSLVWLTLIVATGGGPSAGRPRNPGPQPRWQERLNVQVDREILDELDKIAEREALTRSALVRRVLLDAIKSEQAARR